MRNVFRQFGAKVTGLSRDKFRLSLIKLTSLYLIILAAILLISSSTIYSAFSSRVEHRFRGFHLQPFHQEFAPMPAPQDVRGDLTSTLIRVNGILLILAGILSYGLARWTLRPLRQAFERQKKFLSDASHELRTPLTILRTDLENDLNGAQGANRDQIKSNLEEVERMSALVNDLLLLSRLDENHNAAKKNITAFQLNELVNETVNRLNAFAKEHQVSLVLEQPQKEITLNSDASLLSQALTNIIKNGILYNKPAGKVEIKIKSDAGKARIYVEDTGIGISKDDLKKIFDRFYRAEQSRSRQTGGSGLGLSIARSSIEHIGGTIDAHSEIDKGTKIIIQLPIA